MTKSSKQFGQTRLFIKFSLFLQAGKSVGITTDLNAKDLYEGTEEIQT
eukprot:UN18752